MKDDPRWIKTKYGPCFCTHCKVRIEKGDEAFYFPIGRFLFCKTETCGLQKERDFTAALQDENWSV